MNSKNTERLQSAATVILIAIFAIIAVGTVSIPAILAFFFCWQWMLCYPALFATVIVLSARSGKNRS